MSTALPKSTESIMKLAADVNSVEERIARQVINYQFQYLRKWNSNPHTPQVYLQYLGKWTVTPRQLKASFRILIKEIRKHPDRDYLKEKFRRLWKIRHKVYNFKKKRKRKK